MPATMLSSGTAAAHPPDSRMARLANSPSAGFPMAIERAMVFGTTGTMASAPSRTSRTIGAQPSAWVP